SLSRRCSTTPFGAKQCYGRDDCDGDQSRDQTVFDGRDAFLREKRERKALIILGVASLMVAQVEPTAHVRSKLDEAENGSWLSCGSLTKHCYEIVKKPPMHRAVITIRYIF